LTHVNHLPSGALHHHPKDLVRTTPAVAVLRLPSMSFPANAVCESIDKAR
jgi:hypothetical protein